MLDANTLGTKTLLQKQIVVASGTATAAGVDLQNFVGSIKLILNWAGAAADGSHTMAINLLGSADNTTFTTITSPTFTSTTASSGTQEVVADVDAIGYRYIQARHVVTGTTATFTTSLVAVGFQRTS